MSDGSDLAWLGLTHDDAARWSFELIPSLARFDGKLYGGTGIAAMVATMEAETAREALWATVQYAGSADLGERVELHVEELARGKRTSQVRMTATCNGRTVLAAVGATGALKHDESAIEVTVGSMPDEGGPDDAGEWGPRPEMLERMDVRASSWLAIAEMRQLDSGRIWARMRSGLQTRATLAFLADMVPSAVVRASGRMGGGTSLDNAIRYGRLVDTEWVLLDFDPYHATGGWLHGGARLWAEDGTLLGYASQTATAMAWPVATSS
jgi:acyl-CoA thioesterase